MANWKPDTAIRGALLAACVMLFACSEPAPPEQRVRDFIDHFEQLAEGREWTSLVELIDGDYQDERGNDKLKAAGILRAFYLRNKSVHLLTRIDSIDTSSPAYPTVTLYLAMTRRPFTEEAAANLPRTNMHKLTLELAEDGDSFTILSSTWEQASAGKLIF